MSGNLHQVKKSETLDFDFIKITDEFNIKKFVIYLLGSGLMNGFQISIKDFEDSMLFIWANLKSINPSLEITLRDFSFLAYPEYIRYFALVRDNPIEAERVFYEDVSDSLRGVDNISEHNLFCFLIEELRIYKHWGKFFGVIYPGGAKYYETKREIRDGLINK